MLHLNAALRVLLLLLVTCFGVLADLVSLVAVVCVLLAAFFSERSVYGEVLADRVSLGRTLVSFWALVALLRVLAVAMACRVAIWL